MYRTHLKPAPGSSGGGNSWLQEIFIAIVEWDTFVAGLVQSYLSLGHFSEPQEGQLSGEQITLNAHNKLTELIKQLKDFQPANEKESEYQKKYQAWAEDLFKMTKLLQELLNF